MELTFKIQNIFCQNILWFMQNCDFLLVGLNMLYVKLGQFIGEVLTLFFIKVMARTPIKVKLYLLQLTGKEVEVNLS